MNNLHKYNQIKRIGFAGDRKGRLSEIKKQGRTESSAPTGYMRHLRAATQGRPYGVIHERVDVGIDPYEIFCLTWQPWQPHDRHGTQPGSAP